MKYRAVYIFLLVYFVLCRGLASHADPPDNLTIRIRSSQLSPTIGDSLSIFCTITIPDSVRVSDPYPVQESPFLDLERQGKYNAEAGSEPSLPGITREHYRFLAYAFLPDTLKIGPFAANYITAEGDTGSVLSNELTLLVKGVLENPESPKPPSPMPNRSPVEIASRWISSWMILLVLVLILALAGGLLYYIRKKKAVFISPPPEPIDEIGEFERIRTQKLHEKGEIRELYIQVSNAMRGFIHRNMNFEALYNTSEEIVREIRESTLLSRDSIKNPVLNSIREVLGESDMVKFARYIPPADLSSSIIDRALNPVKTVLEEIAREKARLAREEQLSQPEENENESSVETTVKN